jgi:hypothetical protein
MNLFRSEEHIRSWSGFKPNTEDGINRLSDIVALFSGKMFTRRLDPDYASKMGGYLQAFMDDLKKMGEFWHPPEE